MDAQPGTFGNDQQLGVKEPAVVLHVGQQPPGHLCADGLEAALRVRKADLQGPPQQEVVGPGNELPLGTPADPGVLPQPGPDRDVRVSGEEGCHQRRQRGQVRGQVHVQVGQHLCLRGAPGVPEGEATALDLQPAVGHVGQLFAEPGRDGRCAVSAGIVRDGDLPRRGQFSCQVFEESRDAVLEYRLFVEDRYNNFERQAPIARCHEWSVEGPDRHWRGFPAKTGTVNGEAGSAAWPAGNG